MQAIKILLNFKKPLILLLYTFKNLPKDIKLPNNPTIIPPPIMLTINPGDKKERLGIPKANRIDAAILEIKREYIIYKTKVPISVPMKPCNSPSI